ncbi:MAG: response regulator [Marinobacterium sp.]|nr:response regulator [Marinobacterium sp.]
MDQPQILLIEDDEKLASLLSQYLQRQGLAIKHCSDGFEAPAQIIEYQPDLVILDLMLPGLDGLSICREVRNQYSGRILILTASDDDMDQVAALEMGADDFVTKPLQPRVLLARIRMLLRRQEMATAEMASPSTVEIDNNRFRQHGSLVLDSSVRRCTLADEEINLTPAEFDLLWLLASHPDEILSRESLVKQTRGIEYDGLDRTVDNRIVSLRKKLADSSGQPRRLITVRGKGYLFVPDSW